MTNNLDLGSIEPDGACGIIDTYTLCRQRGEDFFPDDLISGPSLFDEFLVFDSEEGFGLEFAPVHFVFDLTN